MFLLGREWISKELHKIKYSREWQTVRISFFPSMVPDVETRSHFFPLFWMTQIAFAYVHVVYLIFFLHIYSACDSLIYSYQLNLGC